MINKQTNATEHTQIRLTSVTKVQLSGGHPFRVGN